MSTKTKKRAKAGPATQIATQAQTATPQTEEPKIVGDSRYDTDVSSVVVGSFDLTKKKGREAEAARIVAAMIMRRKMKNENLPFTRVTFNVEDIIGFVKSNGGIDLDGVYKSGHPARSAFYRLTCVGKKTMEKEDEEKKTVRNTYGTVQIALEDVGTISRKGGYYKPHRRLTRPAFDKLFPEFDNPTIKKACEVISGKEVQFTHA